MKQVRTIFTQPLLVSRPFNMRNLSSIGRNFKSLSHFLTNFANSVEALLQRFSSRARPIFFYSPIQSFVHGLSFFCLPNLYFGEAIFHSSECRILVRLEFLHRIYIKNCILYSYTVTSTIILVLFTRHLYCTTVGKNLEISRNSRQFWASLHHDFLGLFRLVL